MIQPPYGPALEIPAATGTPTAPYIIAGTPVDSGEFFGPYPVKTRMIRITQLPTGNYDFGGNTRIIRWCGLLWRPNSAIPYPIHENSADATDVYGRASLDFRVSGARGFRVDLPEGTNLTGGTGVLQIWYIEMSDVY